MTGLSRRDLMCRAALLSAAFGIGGSTKAAMAAEPVLLYDASFIAARRFAARAVALGGAPTRLDGDRVRQMRALLGFAPAACFGVSRHGDALLLCEIALEAGYRRLASVQHQAAGQLVASCLSQGVTIGALARIAGDRWPETFAEFALGGLAHCQMSANAGVADPAFSWVLVKS